MARKVQPKTPKSPESVPAGVAPQKMTPFEVEQVEAETLVFLSALMKRWLPEGRLSGHHWVAPHPKSSTHTIRVDLHRGTWTDFSSGASGLTVTSLATHLSNLPAEEVIQKLKAMRKE